MLVHEKLLIIATLCSHIHDHKVNPFCVQLVDSSLGLGLPKTASLLVMSTTVPTSQLTHCTLAAVIF